MLQEVFLLLIVCFDTSGVPETDNAATKPLSNDVFQTDKCSTTNEQNIGGVQLNVLLFGMFSTSLWWYVGHGPFEHFEQCLLDAFARHVSRDGHVLTCLANLVDFVDEHNTPLSGFDIEISSMQQLQQQVLNIFTDVTGFGQRGRIADGKRHL